MSKKSRARHSAPSALNVQRSALSVPAPSASYGAGFTGYGANGHQAAEYSRLRAQLGFPELDTRKEITPATRTEVMRKARWMCTNLGFPRRITFGCARLAAGTGMTPAPITKDKEWNKLAKAYADSRFDNAAVFDVGGRYDFYSAQAFLLAAQFRDGDASMLLTESETGQARFAFYEGHQVGSPAFGTTEADLKNMRDGVRTDAQNCARQYRYLQDEGRYLDVDASNVIFMCDYERAGQSRGTSIFEHAINRIQTSTDILSYIGTGVKLSNLQGAWKETQAGVTPGPASVFGNGAPTTRTITTGTAADGTPITKTVTMDEILGGGVIPDLNPGETIKFNTSAHPHPNQLGLLDYFIRDASWGIGPGGISPELLWNITALGGANTRFALADAQGFIDYYQEKLMQRYCQRVWVYTIAKGMKAGKLRPCHGDPEWWKCGWIPSPRLTVDFGRDGALYIKQNASAMLTLKTIYGWQGHDWEPQVDQWLDEISYIKNGMAGRGLSWDDVQQYRNSMGQRPDATGAASNIEQFPTEPGSAAAALMALAKDETKALAALNHLRSLPAAA